MRYICQTILPVVLFQSGPNTDCFQPHGTGHSGLLHIQRPAGDSCQPNTHSKSLPIPLNQQAGWDEMILIFRPKAIKLTGVQSA